MSGFAFDTPGGEATDTLIERGVIELLQPLVYSDGDPATPEGPYLRTLEPIPQMPEVEFMTRQREEFMRRMPGVLVYVGAGSRASKRGSGSRAWYEREILIVVFSGVAPDTVDGRLNETAKVATDTRDDPGVRVVRQHVAERLNAKYLPTLLAASHTTLQVLDFTELETTEAWSSWGIRLSCTVEEASCSTDSRAAEPAAAIRATHDVQGRGEIARQKVEPD